MPCHYNQIHISCLEYSPLLEKNIWDALNINTIWVADSELSFLWNGILQLPSKGTRILSTLSKWCIFNKLLRSINQCKASEWFQSQSWSAEHISGIAAGKLLEEPRLVHRKGKQWFIATLGEITRTNDAIQIYRRHSTHTKSNVITPGRANVCI